MTVLNYFLYLSFPEAARSTHESISGNSIYPDPFEISFEGAKYRIYNK
jgi:hypothetical protein